jgi:hypothetical protein
MSQKSSDPQAISFVSQPLKRDNHGQLLTVVVCPSYRRVVSVWLDD